MCYKESMASTPNKSKGTSLRRKRKRQKALIAQDKKIAEQKIKAQKKLEQK